MKNKIMNLFYTVLGNFTFAFVKWLILILIVRLTSPEQVGLYTFAMALTTPIVLFVNMRLRLRYVVEDDTSFLDLSLLRNVLNIISFLIVSVIGLLFFREYLIIVMFIVITKLLDLNSDLYYAILHKKSMFKRISILMVIKSIIIFVVFGISLYIYKNLYISLSSQIIAQLLWCVFAERKSIKYIGKVKNRIKLKSIWVIFVVGIPLGIVQLLNSYNILIPRYVIENKLSLEAVGIFASISYLLSIVDLFMNAISQNFIVNIKSKIDSGEFKKLNRFIKKDVIFISFGLGLIVILLTQIFGERVINLIYGNLYSSQSYILTIISISIIFNFQGWMFDTTLMALKLYKVQLISSLITLVISISVSITLIPYYGLLGASLSIVIITFIQAIIKFSIILYILSKEGYVNDNSALRP